MESGLTKMELHLIFILGALSLISACTDYCSVTGNKHCTVTYDCKNSIGIDSHQHTREPLDVHFESVINGSGIPGINITWLRNTSATMYGYSIRARSFKNPQKEICINYNIEDEGASPVQLFYDCLEATSHHIEVFSKSGGYTHRNVYVFKQRHSAMNTANWTPALVQVYNDSCAGQVTVMFHTPPPQYGFTEFYVQLIPRLKNVTKQIPIQDLRERRVYDSVQPITFTFNEVPNGRYRIDIYPNVNDPSVMPHCKCRRYGWCDTCLRIYTTYFLIDTSHFRCARDSPTTMKLQGDSGYPVSIILSLGILTALVIVSLVTYTIIRQMRVGNAKPKQANSIEERHKLMHTPENKISDKKHTGDKARADDGVTVIDVNIKLGKNPLDENPHWARHGKEPTASDVSSARSPDTIRQTELSAFINNANEGNPSRQINQPENCSQITPFTPHQEFTNKEASIYLNLNHGRDSVSYQAATAAVSHSNLRQPCGPRHQTAGAFDSLGDHVPVDMRCHDTQTAESLRTDEHSLSEKSSSTTSIIPDNYTPLPPTGRNCGTIHSSGPPGYAPSHAQRSNGPHEDQKLTNKADVTASGYETSDATSHQFSEQSSISIVSRDPSVSQNLPQRPGPHWSNREGPEASIYRDLCSAPDNSSCESSLSFVPAGIHPAPPTGLRHVRMDKSYST